MTTMSLRRRRPGYHRAAGRALVVPGALVAGSALWMALRYPQEGAGDVLYLFRPAAQAFTMGVGGARFGDGVLAHDRSIASAWLINLAVAEWAVRRRPAPRRRPQPAVVGAQP
jgi:hypothetical protein